MNRRARRIRERFWRRWREVGEEALRGIVAAQCWGRRLRKEMNTLCELHMKDWSLKVQNFQRY
jgi:hypothetical protein